MTTREGYPRQIALEVLLDHFAVGDAFEAHRAIAFHDLLVQRAKLLRRGTTDSTGFLQVLTEDNHPVNTWARSKDAETRKERHFQVARTDEGEILVRTQQDPVWPQITVTVGLSDEGCLTAKDVRVEFVNRVGRMRPHAVEGDVITDVSGNQSMSRQDAGNTLIGHLRNVVPYGK